MSKKMLIGIVFLIVLFAQATLNSNINFAVAASTPTQLKLYVGPPSVPADNSAYNSIFFVQLLDSKNIPARAQVDTIISISSSRTDVGTVEPTVTIPQGATYASGQFHSTFTPGATTITATASGYATVLATINTIGPIPSTLAVFAVPPVIPADGNTYPAIIVQLQDTSGSPARAPIEGLTIALTNSNMSMGSIDSTITIQGGQTYATANFYTNASGPAAAGTAEIIAIAQGYASKTATLKTQAVTYDPPNPSLKLYIGPPKIMADNVPYPTVIAVQLLDQNGKLAKSSIGVPINLASSDTLIGSAQLTTTVNANANYAFAQFSSTYRAGSTIITAGAAGYKSSTATLIAMGPTPSKIAVYCVPPSIPSDNQPYPAVQVQVQDASGKPAKDPNGDVTVNLFSSKPEAGSTSSSITVPYGQTYATGFFFSTFIATSTTITAQASGYDSGLATMTTFLIDPVFLNTTVTVNPTVNAGEPTNIRAYVAYNNTNPATTTTVTFAASGNGNFTTTLNEGNGYYATTFTPQKVDNPTPLTITVNASKTGYVSTIQSAQLTINPNPILFPTPTPKPTPSPTPVPTPRITPTPRPTATPVPTPTLTPSPTATATLTPTQTPTKTPTPSPTPQNTTKPTQSPKPEANSTATIAIVAIASIAIAVTFVGMAKFRRQWLTKIAVLGRRWFTKLSVLSRQWSSKLGKTFSRILHR